MFRRKLLIFPGWALAVLLFAGQWIAYDAAMGKPIRSFTTWSCCLWGVLMPLAIGFASRHPILSSTWMHAVPLHLAIGILLTTAQLSIEAWIKLDADPRRSRRG